MDRNSSNAERISTGNQVALRKESVDRNKRNTPHKTHRSASLSARRAWIEMAELTTLVNKLFVALRKESVDRNYYADRDADWVRVSLSARRAWIEITQCRL